MTVLIVTPPAVSMPRFGYQNLLLDNTDDVTATSENGVYVHENAYDWNPSTFWLPDDGVSRLQLELEDPAFVSYFGLYAHTLAANGGSVQLLWSNDSGATWTPCFDAISPTDTAPIYKSFLPVYAKWWRVEVTSTPASYIGVCSFGLELTMERGGYMGFAPPVCAVDSDVTNSVSNNGVFLGRSFYSRGISSSFSVDHLTETFIRGYWVPFLRHAVMRPFFLGWNYAQWPYEAAFCFSTGALPKPKYTKPRLMSAGIAFDGNIE